MRVLVDTCVIIDALQSRIPFAEALFTEIGDYEDAVMVETAIRTEMDCIVTRNIKDYAKSLVKVCEPCMFLKLLEKGDKEK